MRTLKDDIIALIQLEGPMPVERYMALCLGHPVLGYYMTRDPFGVEGDFITAPEISQMFGELIGLWAAQVWIDMGRPHGVGLVEIGPGRGTLMADALRAVRKAVSGMPGAIDIRMVETSPVLRARQQAALGQADVAARWHTDIATALHGPVIIIANELLDALPVRQVLRTAHGDVRRVVGLGENGELAFGFEGGRRSADTTPALLIEEPDAADVLIGQLASHLAREQGAALFIDYGAEHGDAGDTLQAVRRHAFVDPLADPGLADLTTQVRFGRAMATARAGGARVHGLVTQADFLMRLGLAERATTLKRAASLAGMRDIDDAVLRLTRMDERGKSGAGMGALFKAMCFSHPSLMAIPGFDRPERDAGVARIVET